MRSREAVPDFSPTKLEKLLRASGQTIGQLADRAGLHRQNLNTIITGNRSAAFQTVIDIAAALDVDPVALTDLEPDHLTLQALRLRRGISRVELAQLTGSSYAQLHAVETGRRPLTTGYASMLAHVLDVDSVQIAEAVSNQIASSA